MKQPIDNPFATMTDYNCFACGPDHPFGLHLKFVYDSDTGTASSIFRPDKLFEGFPGILHGGIQATIVDEVAFWGIWARHKRTGFTYDLEIKYKKKCPVSEPIEVIGIVDDMNRRLVSVQVFIKNPETDEIYTEGTVRYYLPSKDPRASK